MNQQAITVIDQDTLQIAERGNWTEADVKLIKAKCAKDADATEFKLLLTMAAKYQLDPLVGHIWCQKYKNNKTGEFHPAQIFVGYNGLLDIANRDDRLDGMQASVVKNEKGEITGAICTVWKRGATHPFVAEVSYKEYKPAYGGTLWDSKPETMIKKVAGAHALRMAFNLGGMYIPEEMEEVRRQQNQQEVVDTVTGEIIETTAQLKAVQAAQEPYATKNEQTRQAARKALQDMGAIATEAKPTHRTADEWIAEIEKTTDMAQLLSVGEDIAQDKSFSPITKDRIKAAYKDQQAKIKEIRAKELTEA